MIGNIVGQDSNSIKTEMGYIRFERTKEYKFTERSYSNHIPFDTVTQQENLPNGILYIGSDNLVHVNARVKRMNFVLQFSKTETDINNVLMKVQNYKVNYIQLMTKTGLYTWADSAYNHLGVSTILKFGVYNPITLGYTTMWDFLSVYVEYTT